MYARLSGAPGLKALLALRDRPRVSSGLVRLPSGVRQLGSVLLSSCAGPPPAPGAVAAGVAPGVGSMPGIRRYSTLPAKAVAPAARNVQLDASISEIGRRPAPGPRQSQPPPRVMIEALPSSLVPLPCYAPAAASTPGRGRRREPGPDHSQEWHRKGLPTLKAQRKPASPQPEAEMPSGHPPRQRISPRMPPELPHLGCISLSPRPLPNGTQAAHT